MNSNQQKPILFIVEQAIIDGKAYFGSSNDLLLIVQTLKIALENGLEIYLTTPKNILEQNSSKQFSALKLSENLDQKEIDNQIKTAWHKQVINCLLALPTNASNDEKSRSKILFLDAKTKIINLDEVQIFNRAEPISLTDQFYDILISWQNNGVKILPNPYLNKILGDKLAVDAIHNNRSIAGINLLAGVNFKDGENKISFESQVISLSKNNLSAVEISQFYDLLIAENFQKAEAIFKDEYEIFMQGVAQYLTFHRQLENDSIIKPASYFGGTGVVVHQNQTLNFNQAIQNIVQSFLAIKQDCQNSNHPDLAFLPAIIVQERATEAHLGDLRIVFCGNNLQGIFVRVNRNFEKSKANNLHFGGHVESLFKHYSANIDGVKSMIDDMKSSSNEEIRKPQALYGLLKILDFLKQIPILKSYPIIGIDALLTLDQDRNYKYGINEINLTSPMGQTQLLLLQMAIKFNHLALEILQKNGLEINLEKYQILADYFKEQEQSIVLDAKEILLQDQHLQGLIAQETEKLLANNLARETLEKITI